RDDFGLKIGKLSHRTSIKDGLGRHIGSCGPLNRNFPYDCIAEDYPWEYWNDRDVRTMVELGQAISFDPKTTIPFEGSRHNALADAIHQAHYVSAIWQRIIAGNQVLQKLMQN
ncbi:3'-5' exonuclease, partial [Klebsiella quasipneumoniae subsp. similipneumoniae]|uniref:3'-5' exonuclease n=1 Tax=Klebsiella quasipneumoniae TaxID=1463165 RepID=UPI0038D2119E